MNHQFIIEQIEAPSVNNLYVFVFICDRTASCATYKIDQIYNIGLKLHKPVVTMITTSLTLKICRKCPQLIHLFCIYLWTNSDLYHLLH